MMLHVRRIQSLLCVQVPGSIRTRSYTTPKQQPESAVPPNPSFNKTTSPPRGTDTKLDKILKFLRMHPDQLVMKKAINRYFFVPAAMFNHICLGAIFAWSILNEPLTRLRGVIVPAASDWTFGEISVVFSLVMGGFVWAGVISKLIDRMGPRASCLLGAASTGCGFAMGAAAIYTQHLPLLYAGGFVWGLANAWAYVPPVSTLLRWFPDKKGFASGSCILGFGAGASIAAPLFTSLLYRFRVPPTYLGSSDAVSVTNIGGKLFADFNGTSTEVVVASAVDSSAWNLAEGVYVVGTGSTGVVQTFLIMGAVYTLGMSLCALIYRFPPHNYALSMNNAPNLNLTLHNIDVTVATRSWQFWLMWTTFGLGITGSYGILSAGKMMLMDGFHAASPEIVTAVFAATFVATMGMANLGGRIFWSLISDYLSSKTKDPFYGRKLTYTFMWGIVPPLYLVVVWSVHHGVQYPLLSLALFSLSVYGILSSFGGSAATRPAICGDIYGTKNVGIMTARQLSVVMPAAYLGPKVVSYFREKAITEAILELSQKVDEKAFFHAFGKGKDELLLLISQKTVTINRLLEVLQGGGIDCIDPTPFVYDQTMFVMASLQALGVLLHLTLKPFHPKYHLKESTTPTTPTTPTTTTTTASSIEEDTMCIVSTTTSVTSTFTATSTNSVTAIPSVTKESKRTIDGITEEENIGGMDSPKSN